MLPLDNILLLQSKYKFSAEIKNQKKTIVHENSFETKNGKHIVIFLPINNIDINLKYSLHLNFLKNRNSVFKHSDIIVLSNSNSLSLPCIYRTSQSQKNDQLAICTNLVHMKHFPRHQNMDTMDFFANFLMAVLCIHCQIENRTNE